MSGDFGIAPAALARLRALFDRTPGLESVWVYGSRARGDYREDSDIDLLIDVPGWSHAEFASLSGRIEELALLYGVDTTFWQDKLDDKFRERIARDRKLFWEPRRQPADMETLAGTELKKYQSQVLAKLGVYVAGLKKHAAQAAEQARVLRAMEGMEEQAREVADFPKRAWNVLKKAGELPASAMGREHSSRFDGAGRPIPNICFKVPTGGGKTLLAAASVGQLCTSYLGSHTGLVLWIVPNEAIYTQTLKALSDRDHPYRQMFNVAGAGKVKIVEKTSPLSRLDVESHLCVMLLMLQSAARQSKETLRLFRDRGNVLGFVPREDDIEAHWTLLQNVPNLDAYAPWGASADEARATKGSIVKSSLGNVMRLLRPLVIVDEGQKAYSELALKTLDGFNPSFMLELSATPRVAANGRSGSNVLVDVRGKDLEEAEMIKLPINVEVHGGGDWRPCLAAAVQQLDALEREADALRADTARYIRPILLVQVERTGAEMRDAGLIHADDAKEYLLQLGLSERQIAIKTSERNDLAAPENIDLLSPTCDVRAIITKQALQEGWDCPFAYVLCALAAGRNMAAMTQLVGRILRQPQAAKTGRESLDACYVYCHDAKTGDVVKGVKRALEGEGMGDLAVNVRGGTGKEAEAREYKMKRRERFAKLRIFLPTVTWVESEGRRRELDYDSDVLAHVDWSALDPAALAKNWAPNQEGTLGGRVALDLHILDEGAEVRPTALQTEARLDRSRLVRAVLDIAPNAWLVWEWVEAVVQRCLRAGFAESALAASSASLLDRLRSDIEGERDRLAQSVFDRLVAEGRIEFRLRADASDYELPFEAAFASDATPSLIQGANGGPVDKSLLEPAFRAPDMNDFEKGFAGYLDQKGALQWWHRNVAKTQYGLQGWRRHKVYPDFVFAVLRKDGRSMTVVMETKGMHLEGARDTDYKQALLERLTQAFRDERFANAGDLALATDKDEIVCDLIFQTGWDGMLEAKYFS